MEYASILFNRIINIYDTVTHCLELPEFDAESVFYYCPLCARNRNGGYGGKVCSCMCIIMSKIYVDAESGIFN